jgi:hypothetical protein
VQLSTTLIPTPLHSELLAPRSQYSLRLTTPGVKYFHHRRDLSNLDHLPTFFAHFDPFGGCCSSNDDNFECPFSKSIDILGVGGSSSILVMPDLAGLFWCTSLGNVERRGVNAATTFFADLRIVLRISHERFLAR